VQVFWPKIVLKKWLNLKSKDLDFGADEDEEEDDGSDIDDEGWPQFPLLRRDPFSFYWPKITSFSFLTSHLMSLIFQRTAAATATALAGRPTTALRSPVSIIPVHHIVRRFYYVLKSRLVRVKRVPALRICGDLIQVGRVTAEKGQLWTIHSFIPFSAGRKR
jgi:hypothetical protein